MATAINPLPKGWDNLPGAEYVVHLDDDSFGKVIKEGTPVLVMFYTSWCGHCKEMKPAYSEAALKLHNNKSPSSIAALNSESNPNVTDLYKIQSFPTLKFFDKGKFVQDYRDARTSEAIISFIKSVESTRVAKKKD
uniref:(California timema) hypothetical protein n=1 Tax=Timema californicum TaxID=61474 RepID=A0A7R9J5X3_TIMCA|nr:unnamed protein product [Timema californicum]